MGHNILRDDKTCLNCRHVVEQRFCPNCGQENIETRKTFYLLFVHFFEDLTHYENAFWKTIKNLLLKPGALTKEYLSGKRLSYLAPIRLYIFISIITFFIIAVFQVETPKIVKIVEKDESENVVTAESKKDTTKSVVIPIGEKNIIELKKSSGLSESESDTIRNIVKKFNNKNQQNISVFGHKSIEQLDYIQKYGKESEKLSTLQYWIAKRGLTVFKNNTIEEILEKFNESFIHNISKVLFIYMPIFAFFLWLFHSKKRWYYFDHGIFTLHYFSFLLLIILILFLFNTTLSLLAKSTILTILEYLINFIGFGWMLYYFYPAHYRFYGETRLVSNTKSILLLFINCFFIMLILMLFAFYTFINIH